MGTKNARKCSNNVRTYTPRSSTTGRRDTKANRAQLQDRFGPVTSDWQANQRRIRLETVPFAAISYYTCFDRDKSSGPLPIHDARMIFPVAVGRSDGRTSRERNGHFSPHLNDFTPNLTPPLQNSPRFCFRFAFVMRCGHQEDKTTWTRWAPPATIANQKLPTNRAWEFFYVG